MKKLSFFKKIVYFFSVLLALVLLLACIIPYFPVKNVPLFSFISLGVPTIVVLNIMSALYWMFIRFKKALFPISALLIWYVFLGSFIQFGTEQTLSTAEDLKVMTYNSYGFKGRDRKNKEENGKNIIKFIQKENPDIVCFQEFDHKRIKSGELDFYPYKFVNFEFGLYRKKLVQAIYSKYPIISQGDLDFPNSYNNAIYVDVLYNQDTVRIYNLHLESLGITSARKTLNKPAEKLYKQLGAKFKKQEEQALLVSAHLKTSAYKKIICGDFNNGQYSRIYNVIKGDLLDSFEEKGSGYGKTYNYHGLPVRIDFILAEETLRVQSHKNYKVKLSDHFPVMASFTLE